MKFCVGFFFVVFFFLADCSLEMENIQDKPQKDALIEVAKRAYERGLTFGTGGDISVRIKGTDRVIVKATGTCFGDLNYNRLSTMNISGEVVGDTPEPSHEAEIHCGIYSLRENVGAIMHVHSPYATAWATVGKVIPAVTQQSVKILKDIAIVPYNPVGSKELVESVVNAYQNPETQVVMMENHGFFIIGIDLYDILYKAEVVENTARIAYICKSLGKPLPFFD